MLSIIIINYKSFTQLKKCLRSISEKATTIKHEVIVVNNDSQEIRSSLSDFSVSTIEINRNIGFGAACNIGSNASQGEYLCFLNPDTEIISSDFQGLLDNFQKNPSLGIIGPGLISSDGLPESWSFGDDINLWRIIKNNLYPEKGSPTDIPFETDWVSGAALFIKKPLFEKLGGFDEKFFMYFEDMDLCRRARELSQKTLHYPLFQIKHIGGGSFENKVLQKNYYYASQDLFFLKHFGRSSFFLLKFFRLFH